MVSIKTRTLLNPGMTMLLSTGCDSGEVDRGLPAMVLPPSSTDEGFRLGRVQGQGVCRMRLHERGDFVLLSRSSTHERS